MTESRLPMAPGPGGPENSFLLASHRQELRLGSDALLIQEQRRSGARTRRIPYGEITHVAALSRGIWIATRRGVEILRRKRFGSPEEPELLAREVIARIAMRPGGAEQLARMSEVAELARRPRPRLATTLFAAMCVGVYLLQSSDPFVTEVGGFAPDLVARGQWWRIVTANFLHGFPLHLAMNVLAALGFGLIVERVIGSLSTVVVLATAGVTSMVASALAGYTDVVGASGAVFGLVGAAFHLELRHPERLPAFWRIPRRAFLVALAAEALIGFALPFVAGAAHVGGFVGGYAVSAWLADRGNLGRVRARGPKLALVAVCMAMLLALGAVVPLVKRDGGALERFAHDLLALSDVRTSQLNDLAWRMATEGQLAPRELDSALALAERAVRETKRSDPDVLDTLAEVLFARGDSLSALLVIEEAILISGGDSYFVEQRRRFAGERAVDDRPEPPRLPWFLRRPPELWERIPEPRVEI